MTIISAVLEGVMIIVAALVIMSEAYKGFFALHNPNLSYEGLLVNGVATTINAVWCKVLISHGRRHRSPALVADGQHLLSDVISSIGVALGVILAIETGWPVLDPLLAALVGLNILYSGWKVTHASLSGLMDEAVPLQDLKKIREVISAQALGAHEAHDLRTRQAGTAIFIDFHLVVAGQTTVTDAHDICDRIERALKAVFTGAVVTIHVEPENKAKHSGVVVI